MKLGLFGDGFYEQVLVIVGIVYDGVGPMNFKNVELGTQVLPRYHHGNISRPGDVLKGYGTNCLSFCRSNISS